MGEAASARRNHEIAARIRKFLNIFAKSGRMAYLELSREEGGETGDGSLSP